MSALVFSNSRTACTAAATILAGELLENPHLVMGLDVDDSIIPVFRSLSAMTGNGLLAWNKSRIFLLKEYVMAGAPMERMLSDGLSEDIPCLGDILKVPPGSSKDWTVDCDLFEESVLSAGGLDIAVITVQEDGTVLFNSPDDEVAPVTHVELYNGNRTVTFGLESLMQAKKLIVLLTGSNKADIAKTILKGGIDSKRPASLLKMHSNLTVILDSEAAILL